MCCVVYKSKILKLLMLEIFTRKNNPICIPHKTGFQSFRDCIWEHFTSIKFT